MKESLDCRSCGACCVCPGDQLEYCDVTFEDIERLNKTFVSKYVRQISTFDNLANALNSRRSSVAGTIVTKWKTMKQGPLRSYEMNTCAALGGSVMHKVSCSIYKVRPTTCRVAVELGDRTCKEVRRAFFETIMSGTPYRLTDVEEES